jgi:alpha-tubulin suppressor-like RCC1 family protein
VKGAVCVKARIVDPSRCATPGACGEGILGGGPGPVDAGLDARPDGGPSDGGADVDGGPSDAGGCATAACALPPPTLALGDQHTCVARAGGAVCVGTNVKAQLGRNAAGGLSETPSAVLSGPGTPLAGVAGVASRYDGSCALLSSGGVSCWGDSAMGQLGTTGTLKVATVATAMQDARAVGPGQSHACWINQASGVRCLGKIGSTPAAVPRDMKLTGVVHIGSGIEYACALDHAGVVSCWGNNDYRQVQPAGASGGTIDTPEIVLLGGAASQIVVGEEWACARVADEVRCWGNNQFAQLARPPSSSEAVGSVKLGGSAMTGVLSIAGGLHFVCARRASDVLCWGANAYGMLGRGGTPSGSADDHSPNPLPVVGLGGFTVVEIAGGRYHACARSTTGEIRCWGQGTEGQLGGPAPLENTATPRKLVLP